MAAARHLGDDVLLAGGAGEHLDSGNVADRVVALALRRIRRATQSPVSVCSVAVRNSVRVGREGVGSAPARLQLLKQPRALFRGLLDEPLPLLLPPAISHMRSDGRGV